MQRIDECMGSLKIKSIRFSEFNPEWSEAPMNARSEQSVTEGLIKNQAKARSSKAKVQKTEWELTDERLDDALKQTFPASDALSITRNVRDS